MRQQNLINKRKNQDYGTVLCNTKDEDVDKRQLIDEIGGILKDKVDEELWRTIVGKIEKLAYNESEEGANDEEPKEKEEEAKDEEIIEEPVVEEEKTEEGKTEVKVENGEAEVTVSMDSIIKELSQRDALIDAIKPIIGDNKNYKKMTTSEVAKYACDRLDLKVTKGQEVSVLRGYIQGAKKANVMYSIDSAPKAPETDEAFEKYLKGE